MVCFRLQRRRYESVLGEFEVGDDLLQNLQQVAAMVVRVELAGDGGQWQWWCSESSERV